MNCSRGLIVNNNYKGIQVYQFIDASRINSDQYVKKLLELELIICFDLEDSIKIFDNIQEIQSDCLKKLYLTIFSNYYRNIMLKI